MIPAIELDKAGARNMLCEHQTKLARDSGISPAVKHQCRCLYERQQVRDVNVTDHALYPFRIFRRSRQPLQFIEGSRLLDRRIGPQPRGKDLPEGWIVLSPAMSDQSQ